MQAGFVRPLTDWFRREGRPLPWREPVTPYRVWISEIMLQQTRIEAVIPYFERFLKAAPDIPSLAAIPDEKLMKLWEGLGYYSRARNLKKTAAILVERFGGALPADYESLLSLPGIGEYTAGAIGSIAFHLPVPAVDGNVMRVAARLENCDADVTAPQTKKMMRQWLADVIPSDSPGDFNAALMELGERICLPNTAPLCDRCPIAAFCKAKKAGTAALLPVRSAKKARRVEQRVVLIPICGDRVLLHKRPETGLLSSLWEFPNGEGTDAAAVAAELPLKAVTPGRSLPAAKHIFTHIEWQMTGAEVFFSPQPLPEGYALVSPAELRRQYALPTAFKVYAGLVPILINEKGDAKP